MNAPVSVDLDRLSFLTAAELAAGYRSGDFSPDDVARSHIARIAALDAAIHAYVEVYAPEAMAAAAASTQRFVQGSPLGPLDGIPVAIKDLVEMEGHICTAGSALRLEHISTRTATLVTRLLAQGAVLLGKVHTVEFALGGWGTNAHLGSPRNPWAAGVPHTAGGSSSGSAAAVAARLATLAVGTDTGGSVRVPAGFNGLVGLKTTRGHISLHGVTPCSPTLDTVGPIARTVEDATLLLTAMCGPDPLDPATERVPTLDLSTVSDGGVAGMTLSVLDVCERKPVCDEVLAAYDAALEVLAGLGARLVPLDLPKSLSDFASNAEIMMAEAYALYGHIAEDPSTPMDPGVRSRVLSGAVSAKTYIASRWRAASDAAAMRAAMRGVHAFLLPTSLTSAIPLANVDERTTPALFTRFVNQIDFCSLAVPAGFTAAGLPLSLQIVCRPFEEATALRIGRAYECATTWTNRVPPMARIIAGAT